MRKMAPGIVAVLAALIFGLWALPALPEQVATHWGLDGQPDGWSSRTSAAILLPAIGVGMGVLLGFLPRIDPRRADFYLHAGTYWLIANAVLVFLAIVHSAVIGSALGWPIPLSRIMAIGIGGLLLLIGNLMTRMRPNWFMGIRTPWTLSSDLAWRKTHRLAGYGFVGSGVLSIVAGIVRPEWAPWILMISLGAAGLGSVIYSWIVWRDEQERSHPEAHS